MIMDESRLTYLLMNFSRRKIKVSGTYSGSTVRLLSNFTSCIDLSDFNQCCGQPMFLFNYKPVIHGPTNDDRPEIITEFINCNYMETKGLKEFCEKESLFRTWHLPLQRWQGRKKILKT